MLLTRTEINNRDLPHQRWASLCSESESNHENILLMAKLVVNDINQAKYVLIVLDDLSDNKL